MTLTSIVQSPVQSIAKKAQLHINGGRPFDPQVHPLLLPPLALRVMFGGSLAWGRSYMEGWWSADDVCELTIRLLESGVARQLKGIPEFMLRMRERFLDPQSATRAVVNIQNHYDAGPDFFDPVLGAYKVYSCGYTGRGASSLAEMQSDKMNLTIEKTGIQPGDTFLDVGCGYGELMYRAATKYGARLWRNAV